MPPKIRTVFSCSTSDCGWTGGQWHGSCPSCKKYATISEGAGPKTRPGVPSGPRAGFKASMDAGKVSTRAQRVRDIDLTLTTRIQTGIGEFDRALGGGLVPGGVVLFAGEPGAGKALALDTPLPTPSGWTTMGEVRVGDFLFGADGLPTKVVAVTGVMHGRPCREVVFSDRTAIVADAGHQWFTATQPDRLGGRPGSVKTTEEIARTMTTGSGKPRNHAVRLALPLCLPDVDLPVPPYTLGVRLGDGTPKAVSLAGNSPRTLLRAGARDAASTSGAGTTHRLLSALSGAPAAQVVRERNRPWHARKTSTTPERVPVAASHRCAATGTKPVRFRTARVFHTKHIPAVYLRASEVQRRELLAGLLAANRQTHNGHVHIDFADKQLADTVYELIVSLGYRPARSQKTVKAGAAGTSTVYRSRFLLAHKNTPRYVVSADRGVSVPVRCVQVDNADHMYLAGTGMVPTHNSTLLLDVCQRLAQDGPVLYVSGEESAAQIRLRAERTGADAHDLWIAAETDLGSVVAHIDEVQPRLVVVDSIQTIASPDIEGGAGGVSQVKGVSAALTRLAKDRGLPMVLVGQVTKDGSVAGPRILEHLVDVVLHLEGEQHSTLRLLRVVKNRYGSSDDVACFQMTGTGIEEVPDPSGLFLTRRDEPVAGTCVTVIIEGRRAMPAELQSLVGPSPLPQPRRGVSGLDKNRMDMLIAVVQRHANVKLFDKDVFLATVAGQRLAEPAADLAAVLALMSAANGTAIPNDVLAIGEVALSGDIRPVTGLERRLDEAKRLGFKRALVPPGSQTDLYREKKGGLTVITVENVSRAAAAVAAFNRVR